MSEFQVKNVDVVKAAKHCYHARPEILELLEDLRMMVNDCIRIGLSENITSMKKLSLACYHRLPTHDAPTEYRLTAASKAAGILRAHRKEKTKNPETKTPYAKKLILVGCYGFRIFGRFLRILYRPNKYVFVILNDHVLKAIAGRKVNSITLTPTSLSLCHSKNIPPSMPQGLIGIDNNLDNLTLADSDGEIVRYDLSRATRVRAICRETKRHFTRNDARIRRQVFGKYGKIQRNRVTQLLHQVSSRIVENAKKNKFGIVMEDLT